MPIVKIKFLQWILIAGLLVFSACAVVPLAYNNADVLVRLRVQEHFDLQDAQLVDFNARLARLHRWHRTEELPQYEALFRAAEPRMGHGLTKTDIQWATQTIRERYQVLMRHVAEESAPVLAKLTAAQLGRLEKQFGENNRKFFKDQRLGESEDKRLKYRIKSLRKQLEEWIGPLTPEQEARVITMAQASAPLAKLRLEERKYNQQRFLELLRNHRASNDLAPKLQDMLVNIESHRTPSFAKIMHEYEANLTQLLLDIDKTLTPAQRTHARERFLRYAKDFRELALK